MARKVQPPATTEETRPPGVGEEDQGPPGSPFPQMEPGYQGVGTEQPEIFGVRYAPQPEPEAQRKPAAPVPEGPPLVLTPEEEYIRQFTRQSDLLQRIYDALTGRARPPQYVYELRAGLLPVKVRIARMILTNPTAAGIAAIVTFGTRAYLFALQANQTITVELPLVLDAGTQVTLANGTMGYLVGDLISAEGG